MIDTVHTIYRAVTKIPRNVYEHLKVGADIRPHFSEGIR